MPTRKTTDPSDFCLAPDDSSSSKLPSGRSRPEKAAIPITRCITAGKIKHTRHARSSCIPKELMAAKSSGITKLVKPPPRLPQPPAVAFARPTIFLENMTDTQAWHATKDARPMPIKERQTMKPIASVTYIIASRGGIVIRSRIESPFRAPHVSAIRPMTSRKKMVLPTEAMAAAAICDLVSWRETLIYGSNGAAANVEKKVAKKPNHAR
mmetsp:Transcript_835/g.1375  ORF Transcript_835/g.1375 Transcript_835/m.1375 type:complete len:210 (+) Transcript_835:1541-2170(+)